MKQKRPSIKDIAKALNVSITTISFVLNGKGEERKISKEVIKKIEDYVEEINYTPNQVAQSLRTGESKILVFMVEDISNSFFANIFSSKFNLKYCLLEEPVVNSYWFFLLTRSQINLIVQRC